MKEQDYLEVNIKEIFLYLLYIGMAFVKYKDIEQGMKAFEAMNGMDIQGRKLRIEYKRKVKGIKNF